MRTATIQKQHDPPASPLAANVSQMLLKRVLIPFLRLVQANFARADVHGPVNDFLVTVSGNRHFGLMSDGSPAGPQRRRFGQNRGVSEEDDGASSVFESGAEPPFACLHVFERRARTYRGRFQR